MPTWDDARSYLRTKYKLMKDEPTWVGLGFGFKIGDREVLQRISVESATIEKLPALVIWGDVVEATLVPHEKALARNMGFAIGGLAIHKGLYVLRASLPLDGLDWSTLDTVLVYLAREAGRLRDSLPPGS